MGIFDRINANLEKLAQRSESLSETREKNIADDFLRHGTPLQKPAARYEPPQSAEFDFEIVGESQYKTALAGIIQAATQEEQDAGEIICTAQLQAEPENPFDPKAVRVTIGGQTVGYIPKSETARFHKLLKANEGVLTYMALVGWNPENIASGVVGVRLNLS